MIYGCLWQVIISYLRRVVSVDYILAIHWDVLRLNARGPFNRWVSRELRLLPRLLAHLIMRDRYVGDRFLIPLSTMTASRWPQVCLRLVILLVFGSDVYLLFRPVLRVKKSVRVRHRVIRIKSEEGLHDCLLLLRVKFSCKLIFFLGQSQLRCALRSWRCRTKVVLLCTHYFRGQIPASIGRGQTILARFYLVNVWSYPVSVLAVLTTQRCLQRRVASSSPTWFSCIRARPFPINAW